MRNPKIALMYGLFATLLCASACAAAPTAQADHSYMPAPSAPSYPQPHQTYYAMSDDGGEYAPESVAIASAERAPERQAKLAPAPQPSAADRHAVQLTSTEGPQQTPQASIPDAEPEKAANRGTLLIYTGGLVLASYEVEQTQEKAVALVDDMGGYVSSRTTRQLTVRVPAPKFREALEALAALGDVLDQSWRAHDVSDEVRDLDIRLANAQGLRKRLEDLLARANTVEEALQIEAQLERITLEIERIKGSLKSFEDRIAFSTIELSFQPKSTEVVPKEDFLLPFQWLNTLGLESLLRAPSVYR